MVNKQLEGGVHRRLQKKRPRIVTAVALSLGFAGAMVPVSTFAQTGIALQDTQGLRGIQEDGKAAAKRPQVTVLGKDSSVRWYVREVARQARWTPSFYGEGAALSRRVSIELKGVDAMQALATILRGTNLVARVSADGQTLIIREEKPTVKSTVAAIGHISGVVIDSTTKKGIPGVAVTVPSLRRSIVTQADGKFRLTEVPVGEYTLSAKLIGFQSKSATVTVDSGRTAAVIIVLKQTSEILSEVVTTATGTQRRIEVSNDVVKINAPKLIESAPIQNVTDLLIAAQVPGMNVTRSSGDPGAVARIRFGGPGSISQNNDPVVIVDGVWINAAFSTADAQRKLAIGNTSAQSLPSRLDAIDPATIESIEIVRGPSAATLYGPDAANGVIKITTKRGQAGPTRWDFRGFRTWATPGGTKPFEYYGYGQSETSTAPVRCTVADVLINACVLDSVTRYSPSDPFLQNEGSGRTNGYSLSVTGGANVAGRSTMMYNLTATMQDQLGVRRVPAVDRVRFRQLAVELSNSMVKPSEKRDRGMSTRLTLVPKPGFDVSLNVDGSQMNSREDLASVSAVTGSINAFDTIGTLSRVMSVSRTSSSASSTRGLASLNANISPLAWWNSNVTVGVDRGYTKENRVIPRSSCFGGVCKDVNRSIASVNSEASVYTARIQSSFLPNLGWASRMVTLRPGFSADLQRTVNGSRSFEYTVQNDGSSTQSGIPVLVDRATGLAGMALSVNVRLFDRLSFDPAIRRDFGSRRSLRNNAKTYPRFGTSWVVSDESFFPRQQFMSLLRLRLAMGFAAVQPEYGAVNGGYSSLPTILDGKAVSRVDLVNIGNPNLEPERSFELETGFDADLFGDRAVVTVTHSNKQNKNTLINRSLPPSAGVQGGAMRQENVARVVNKTTTVQLTGRVIDRPGLFVQLTSNVSMYDNRIKTLGDQVSPFGVSEQRYVAGYPVGGIWQRPLLALHDANGNGVLETGEFIFGDSVQYVGVNLPRFTTGYRAEVRVFNRVSLNAMFNYKGGSVQNRSSSSTTMRGTWDPTAPLEEQILAQFISKAGHKDLQSISELRMQSASITIDAPPRFASQLRARSMQISLQGSNLGLWTKYRGRDPGVNSSVVGEMTTDNGFTIPPPKDFVLQIRLGY